jgi:hypothetical protein
MFINAIAAVGNYGGIYAWHFESKVPRTGLNFPYTNGETGLLYAYPLDGYFIDESVPLEELPGPVNNGTRRHILNSGELRYGILATRPGLVEFNATLEEWVGLDVDYCRALSAPILPRTVIENMTTVTSVRVDSDEKGLAALANGTIDVLAG